MKKGSASVGRSTFTYEPTGLRPQEITHLDDANATVDARAYSWDGAYNLEEFQITGGALASSPVDLGYDALNRLEPGSIGAPWSLDDAGNRTGADYLLAGRDAQMNRYSQAEGLPQFHDPRGALVGVQHEDDVLSFYHYDALDRLADFRSIGVSSASPYDPLDLGDGDWSVIDGTWAVNDNATPTIAWDDYLEETTSATGTITYQPDPLPHAGFTFRYWSSHSPENADGDGTPAEFRGDDYTPKYYAQALLFVSPSGPPYFYGALRIEPDRLSAVLFDGTDLVEFDAADVPSEANTWYTVKVWYVEGGPGGGHLSDLRFSDTPGDSVALLLDAPLDEAPGPAPIGFTVGENADYRFQLVSQADTPDPLLAFTRFTYDALGRKVASTRYALNGDVTAQTLHVYDGWRLVSELDALHGNRPVAEYIPGPAYIDDTIAARRDFNDGDFKDAGESFYYFLSDQQHSTIALLDNNGNVVERYGYDAFGAPSFYDANGTPLTDTDSDGTIESAYGNNRLYTGREWLPQLSLYDYRQRLYNPATGRFLTTDPAYDPNNLGNPYTYLKNNPYSFVDPLGLSMEQANPGWASWTQGFFNAFFDMAQAPAPPAPTPGADPNDLLVDFLQRSGSGDNTRGLGSYRATARKSVEAGRDAVHWGTTAGSFAPVVGPVVDIVQGATEAGEGNWAGAIINGLGLAAVVKHVGGADDAATFVRTEETAASFKSFKALKRGIGPAGEGKVWHHIVEQSQLDRFGAEAIHNPANVVAVTVDVNVRLNALYSSIRLDITGSSKITVREWLKDRTFEEASLFGKLAVERVTTGVWP